MNRTELHVASILESITDGLVTLDSDWRFTFINAQAERALGRPRAELLGKCVWDEFLFILGTEVEQQLRRTAAERVAGEYRGHDPQQNRWYDNRVFPIPDGGVAIYFRDVTKRKVAEEELAYSRHFLERLTSVTPNWLAVDDILEDRNVYINRAVETSLGYSAAQLRAVRDRLTQFIHPEDVPRIQAFATDFGAIADEEVRTIEYRVRHADGSYRWVLSRVRPFARTPDGRIQQVFWSSMDTTELKQTEEALRESEERFRVMADTVPGILFSTTADGWTEYVSARFYEYTGMAPGSALAHGWLAALHPDKRAEHLQRYQKFLAAGAPFEMQFHLRNGQGDYRWFLSRSHPMRDPHGTIVRWLGAAHDIEDMVRAETSLRQAHEEVEARVRERTTELAQANAALSSEIDQRRRAEAQRTELLRRLATAQEDEHRRISRELHDQVGQQLTSLILTIKAVKDGGPGPDLLEHLQRTAKEVGNAVRDLALRLRPAVLDDLGLAAALQSAVDKWSRHAGLAVDFHCDGLEGRRLPGEVETTLYRVVLEALHNTLKHARARHIWVILERRADQAVAIVEDDGAGFDPAAVMNTASERLGLLGMRERVALLGGSLQITAAPGAGTMVLARIPLPACELNCRDDGTAR